MGLCVGLLILLVSDITVAFSQTFYPRYFPTYPGYYGDFSPPPPSPSPPPPNSPPPPPPNSPPLPVPMQSSRSSVGTAVGITFAATLILCGVLFLLFLRFSKRGKNKVVEIEALPVSNGFLRVNQNLKGVIVDENGLDVLYWKNMESNRISFKKHISRIPKPDNHKDDDGGEEQKTLMVAAVSTTERKKKSSPLPKTPLLKGESSTSDSPIWSDNRDSAVAPPLKPAVSKSAEMKMNQDSDHGRLEGDIMEALFGYVATKKMEKATPSSPIFILDPLKSEKTALLLQSLGATRKEIIGALVEGQGLDSDTIEKLVRIAPTEQEASQLLGFNGDHTRLAEAESFLYHVVKTVPSAFTRLEIMLFRITFESEVSKVKESLQCIEAACKEIRSHGVFLKLVEGVLKSGNRLSSLASGTNAAPAFNITALRKLANVKSLDGQTTLLQFVVHEVIRAEGKLCLLNRNRSLNRTGSVSGSESESSVQNDDLEREYLILGLPVVGGLSTEFSNLKKAASLDQDALFQMISNLASRISETQKMMAKCGPDGGGFTQRTKGFLQTAGIEMNMIKEEQKRVTELAKEIADYYYAGTSRDHGANPSHLFVMARDFVTMVDQACVEITRNVQKRKPGSPFADSTPRVFKFPKLQANFMSDNHPKINSSSDTENSQVR